MIEWIVSSSVLIAVVIALRFLLQGKITAKLQYALWALVLIRLLMPSGLFETGFSVENVISSIKAQSAVQDVIVDIQTPAISYEDAYKQAEEELHPEDAQQGALPDAEPAQPGKDVITQRAAQIVKLSTPSFLVENALHIIWYAGIAVVALSFLLSNIKFAVTLKRKRSLLSAGRIDIYTCEGLETPCLFGFVKPSIYLTPEDAEDEVRSRHILAHERTHFRHLDHIWSVLRCVCLALHWYNPLVWVAAILSRRDSELACDEATIQKLGEGERIPYGQTLVTTTCAAKATTGLLGIATTMTGSMAAIKERIVMIAKKAKFNVYALTAMVLVAAVAVGCTFTGSNDDNEIVTVYCVTEAKTTSARDGKIAFVYYKYDDNGRLVSVKADSSRAKTYSYDENGNMISYPEDIFQAECTYDENGNLLTKKLYQNKVKLHRTYVYTYDDRGNLIKEEMSGNVTTMTYDDNGNMISSVITSPNSPTIYIYQEFDADGNMVKYTSYYDDELRIVITYTYDLLGRYLTKEHILDGEVISYIENKYDYAGNVIMQKVNSQGMAPVVYTCKYDLNGNKLEETGTYEDGESFTSTWTFDNNGNLLCYDNFTPSREEYIYDAHGNILTKLEYYDDKLDETTEYTYTSFQMRRSDAEKVLTQQAELFSLPVWDAPVIDWLLNE